LELRIGTSVDGRRGVSQMAIDQGRTVETAVEARAGYRDRPVLVVLCVSLALVVLIFGALWFVFNT
jgi:cobalamin biosynthesis Mg chelatase CobN